jgi:hypothetical protein
MMQKSEIIEWLNSIDADEVGIDEGGLSLSTADGSAYCEDEEEREGWFFFSSLCA